MDRRHVLQGLVGTGIAAMGVPPSPSLAAEASADGAAAAGATVSYLTCDPRFTDGRPGFSPDGSLVLFERTPETKIPSMPSLVKGVSSLWTIPVTQAATRRDRCRPATLLYQDPEIGLDRADWSWNPDRNRDGYEIACTGNGRELCLLDATDRGRRRLRVVPCDDPPVPIGALNYPSWRPDGSALVQTNYADAHVSLDHQVLLLVEDLPPKSEHAHCTALTDPAKVWPGMCSVSHTDPDAIVFAGQAPNHVVIPNAPGPGEYSQMWNQIWLQRGTEPPGMIDGIQGRAPWWGPSGERIAFESARNLDPDAAPVPFLRIWVQTVNNGSGEGPFRAVLATPPDLSCQHAKWSPDGKRLVFAYSYTTQSVSGRWGDERRTEARRWGIALVDAPES